MIVIEKMEYDLIEGKTIEYLKKQTNAQRAYYYKYIAETAQKMHDKGYVHLDIKLENIMFGNNFQKLRLLDFGWAQEKTLYARSWSGTIYCMAPELKTGAKVDRFGVTSLDVYSLSKTFLDVEYMMVYPDTLDEKLGNDWFATYKGRGIEKH